MNDIDFLEKITQACKLLDEEEEYIKDLDDRHSFCDMSLSDMWHLIENNDVEQWSKGEMRNVLKEIKSVCSVRRRVKVDVGLRKIYQDNIGKLNNSANRAMLLEKLNKACRSYNCDYTYRIYSDDDINKLVAPKEVEESPDFTEKIQEDFGEDLE